METAVPRANATAETAVATTREVVDVAVAKSRRWQRQRRGVEETVVAKAMEVGWRLPHA